MQHGTEYIAPHKVRNYSSQRPVLSPEEEEEENLVVFDINITISCLFLIQFSIKILLSRIFKFCLEFLRVVLCLPNFCTGGALSTKFLYGWCEHRSCSTVQRALIASTIVHSPLLFRHQVDTFLIFNPTQLCCRRSFFVC